MGLPTTEMDAQARAPPRASPSSLVRTTPVKSSSVVEGLGGLDGVLARHGVHHEQDLAPDWTASRTAEFLP